MSYDVGVRVPSPAHADLAQLAEHLTSNEEVGGSNPLVGIYNLIALLCGSSSVVEHHLAMVGVAGSNPVFRFHYD